MWRGGIRQPHRAYGTKHDTQSFARKIPEDVSSYSRLLDTFVRISFTAVVLQIHFKHRLSRGGEWQSSGVGKSSSSPVWETPADFLSLSFSLSHTHNNNNNNNDSGAQPPPHACARALAAVHCPKTNKSFCSTIEARIQSRDPDKGLNEL